MYAPADRPSPLKPGDFASSLVNPELGIGKIARVTDDEATIEYFDSVDSPVAYSEDVLLEEVARADLEPKMRVYFRAGAIWQVGRVVDVEAERVRVRTADEGSEEWLRSSQVNVRWDVPLRDPAGLLAAFAIEHPAYFQARRAFVDAMLTEDAASRGNRALTSSAVELHAHQMGVAVRVLSDPVRRFLLADEVGMGKTIEAGFVIRQHLIDYPGAVVRIVAPERMCHQWVQELSERFFIDLDDMSNVRILATENTAGWIVPTADVMPDLLVIDEAHHVARWAHGSRPDRLRYARAAELAHAAVALLLLSATPVAQNEATFLAMLYLLDPDNYRLNGLVEFKRRVEQRHDLARAFVMFRPGQKFRRLEQNAERLRTLLQGDAESVSLLDGVLAARDKDSDEIDRRIRVLRTAISDRHRIHYRMLRNRRDDVSDFAVRGRRVGAVLRADAMGAARLAEWLDRWRNAVMADAVNTNNDWRPVAEVLLCRALAFPDIFGAAVLCRLGSRKGTAPAQLDPVEEESIAAYPPGAEELETLEAWPEYSDIEDIGAARIAAVVDYIAEVPVERKIVVFTTFASAAIRLKEALTERLGGSRLVAHLKYTSIDKSEEALRQFQRDPGCNVLVCDASGEEGLNLQFADVVVHAELPLDPNRLEQRIGRLDRYGLEAPVENVLVFDGNSGSFLDSWGDALTRGFRVFDESISSYQFLVDRLVPELLTAFASRGPTGIGAVADTLPELLAAERKEILEQDQLDAIEAIEVTYPVADVIRALDTQWEELALAHERLLCAGPGALGFERLESETCAALCAYAMPRKGARPGLTLSPREIAGVIAEASAERGPTRWGSHSRAVALRHPGARVWSAGDQMLDGVFSLVRDRDERGRAFAIWRYDQHLDEDSPTVAIRVDVIVEAGDPDAATFSGPEVAVLKRRVRALMPPTLETVWIAPGGREVTDPEFLAQLSREYDPTEGDQPVTIGRRRVLDGALAGIDWEQWCLTAPAVAEEVALSRAPVVERAEWARAAAGRIGLARVEALRTRNRILGESGRALVFEQRAAEVVRAAASSTRCVIDAIGLVIISGQRLDSAR
jgi:ATP-dependent helicase HepA